CCVSCDWSQLVTWYKVVVNSLVPCDLCDHSQISHVVSNDVRSDILLTTLHGITDWPIMWTHPALTACGSITGSRPVIYSPVPGDFQGSPTGRRTV
ncbi:unnamed protein product, partial [Staurois parvus]